MLKLATPALLLAASVAAQDATALLAKARTAFIENHERERFWNWTTVSLRSIVDKNGAPLEELPSVTIDSPIRSDGKRCNAVLAWGDGVEPYLANASADERCSVEKEVSSIFKLESFLESRQVKIQSRSDSAITLAIREDKSTADASDPVKRCVASTRGTIQIDLATYFPVQIEVTMPGVACEQKKVSASNHYDDAVLKNVTGGYTKGTLLRFDYELQKDKTDDAAKNFWICVRTHSVRPLQKKGSGMLISGRRFELSSSGPGRSMLLDGRTTASELSAESLIKFETVKEK